MIGVVVHILVNQVPLDKESVLVQIYLMALPLSRPINLAITFLREIHQVDGFYISKSVQVSAAE